MADTKVRITQVKSTISTSPRHRATMKTLGLRGIGKSVVRPRTESLEGQLRLVNHLIKVEEDAS